MKRINVAELLKDCPSGMELNCTMYDNLYFDKVVEEYKYPISCYIVYDGYRISVNFTEFGEFNNDGTAKCVIFPKGKTTWEGFHRPFKDGDIISDNHFDSVCIFKGEGNIEGTVDFYCGIYNDELYIKDVKDRDEHFGEVDGYNFATKEEKQKLFDAIKTNGYRWNTETKTLEKLVKPKFKIGDKIVNDDYVVEITEIDSEEEVYIYKSKVGGVGCILFSEQDNWELVPRKFDINTLKPFDKVLVMYCNATDWKADYFSHYDKEMQKSPFCCIGAWYEKCIPYEGNEHLLGTTDECDDYYKTW